MEALRKENSKLKGQLKFANNGKRVGFAMFYAAETRNNEMNAGYVKLLKRVLDAEKMEYGTAVPTHIINELKDLYEETKKEIECPICLDAIDNETLCFSSCGHKYHKACYDKLIASSTSSKCAMCRKKLYAKS